jgi:tetratricopeptide (TPR) repeat protein
MVAACVSAGFAAARYAWSQTNVLLPEHLAVAEAQRALSAQDPSARLHLPTALHHGPQFAFAREFIRSRREPFVAAGIEILQDLKSLFAAALEVWQELALAHFELFDLTGNEAHLQQSERVLRQIDARCPQPHYETLCRWGRLWKDRGDRQFDQHGDCPGARSCYREALRFYQRAFDQERNYYPGINVVTLSLLLGEEGAARSLAQSIFERVDALPRDSTAETVWRLATAAEAALVLGRWERAADLYRSAITHSKCQPHNRESMQRQVQRILRVRPSPAVDFDLVFQIR